MQAMPLMAKRTQFKFLYISHALSTWNARSYEFAAILFTASAFPDTLLASSIRGLVVTFMALSFSSWIGSQIDTSSSRLKCLLLTTSINRVAIISACLGWIYLVDYPRSPDHTTSDEEVPVRQRGLETINESYRLVLFGFVIILGSIEKLSSIGNMLSMEREWVPAMAGLQEGSSSLTSLNATMRRIDLICKLAAPVFVALIVAAFGSNRCCVLTIAGMNCISWGIEALTAYQVWRTTPRLQERRDVLSSISSVTADTRINNSLERFNNVAAKAFEDQIQRLKQYFASDVWIPSVALAMLHISVLSYSATLITYLLNSGFSVTLITTARASSSVVEISSTFVAPVGVSYLAKSSKRHDQAEEDFEGLLEEVDDEGRMHSAGLERLGLWGIWSQLLNLVRPPSRSSLFSWLTSCSSQCSLQSIKSISPNNPLTLPTYSPAFFPNDFPVSLPPCQCQSSLYSHSCPFPAWVCGYSTSPPRN